MPIHPTIGAVLDLMKERPGVKPTELSLGEVRANHLAMSLATDGPLVEMSEIVELSIPTRSGEIAARLYVPSDDAGDALGVYFHGGGFVLGTLDSYDGLARRLADASNMRVLSVAYRLAPEHPFPSGPQDCEDAVRWVFEHRGELGHADAKVVLLGDSAGGTLAAVTTNQLCRELPISLQVLLYPTMGPEILTESVHTYGTGYFLEMDHLRHNYDLYLQGLDDHTDPRVTPLLAPDLSGTPPTIIVIAECDPLRDEAENYAGLLEHFGVRVELLEALGMPHSFFKLGGIVSEALDEMKDLGGRICLMVESA